MATEGLREMTPDERKKGNLRLALILASVALVFFVGFIAKMWLLSGH
jgi:hypothetical protein